MKKKFSEITIHKQLEKASAKVSCFVEIEDYNPVSLSFDETMAKIQLSFYKEFARIPVGSSLRIMVLTQEREVHND